MKIDKAIEILELLAKGEENSPLIDKYDAHKLGIEALKRLKAIRTWTVGDARILLPGETGT